MTPYLLGESGSSGSYTSSDPRAQHEPVQQGAFASNHPASIPTTQPCEPGPPPANPCGRSDKQKALQSGRCFALI